MQLHIVVFLFTFFFFLPSARPEDHHKRAPSGFTGVRGKKSIQENSEIPPFYKNDVNEIVDDDERDHDGGSPQLPAYAYELQLPSVFDETVIKRAPSMGFVGMRGKKPWEGMNGYLQRNYEGLLKRAPSGFFGMRGKKNDESDPSEFDLDKRMNAGFFGMRGKKENDDSNIIYLSEKRAPSMGFVGMRGRKNFDESDFDKRAPSGFFGMRGKKEWGQWSMRGKKIPYQFRSKFVGVRGKKTVLDGDFETVPNSDLNQLMSNLIDSDKEKMVPKPGIEEV